MDVDPRSLKGMITQLKTNPKKREDLMKLGYVDQQIPDWVDMLRPDLADQAGLPAAAVPTKPSIRIEVARKKGAAQLSPASPAQAAQPSIAAQPTTLRSAAAFDAANRILGPGGRHIESLGSDALLDRWRE